MRNKNPSHGIGHVLFQPLLLQLLFSLLVGLVAFGQSSDPTQPANRFVPAVGQKFYLDLDSASGAYSQWRHEDLGSLNSLRGVLRVLRLGKDNRWSPTFSIGLQSKDKKNSTNDLWLRVVAVNGKLPMKIHLVGHADGNLTQEIPLQTSMKLNEDLEFEVHWETPKLIAFKIGNENLAVKVKWPVNDVIVTASTGELKIDPLLFGIVAP